jgi:hypothetical protein
MVAAIETAAAGVTATSVALTTAAAAEVALIGYELYILPGVFSDTMEDVEGAHEAADRARLAEDAFNAAALAALAIEIAAIRGDCPKGCTYEKKRRIGGNSRHNEYAARLADGEWLVTTPPLPPLGLSVSARYDSGRPGLHMYEAKTGYEFLHNRNLWYRPFIVVYLNAQFGIQSFVAKVCGIGYTVAVDNESGERAIKDAVFSIFESDIQYTPR